MIEDTAMNTGTVETRTIKTYSGAERIQTVRREEVRCQVKLGRTGSKTHRGYAVIEILDEGKPWERKTVVQAHSLCGCTEQGRAMRFNRSVRPLLGTDPNMATCGHCNPQPRS